MPTFASTMMNAVPRLVLGSPLHPLMSARYVLLTFTGRKTGTRYTTPVAYVSDGDDGGRLLISTDSPWGRNVIGGRAVTMRLRGRVRHGVGYGLTDPARSEPAMRALLGVPGYARAAGVERVGGTVSDEQVRRAAAERTVIAIELEA